MLLITDPLWSLTLTTGRTVGVAARGDSHGESRVASRSSVLQVLIRELTWFRTDHVLIFVIRPDNGIWQTFMEPC